MLYSGCIMLSHTKRNVLHSPSNMRSQIQSSGFTIVELLIVVVVIAILAAIVIVAYNGIQTRARDSSVQTSVKQASTKILTYATLNNDSLPADLATIGLVSSGPTSYQYTVNNSSSPRTFCVSVTEGAISYFVSNTSTIPTVGTCNSPPEVVASIYSTNPISNATLYNDGGGSIKLATIFYSYNTPFKVKGGRVYLPSVPADTSLTIFYVKSWNAGGKVQPPNWYDVPSGIPGQYATLASSSLKVGWNEVTFPTQATVNPYIAGVDGTSVWIGYYFSNGNYYVHAPVVQPSATPSAANPNLFVAESTFENGNRSVFSLGGGTGAIYAIDILSTAP